MKTISVQLSDMEYSTFGMSKDFFLFSEFIDLIEQQTALNALRQSVILAEQNKISSLTMDEINAEINALRECKK